MCYYYRSFFQCSNWHVTVKSEDGLRFFVVQCPGVLKLGPRVICPKLEVKRPDNAQVAMNMEKGCPECEFATLEAGKENREGCIEIYRKNLRGRSGDISYLIRDAEYLMEKQQLVHAMYNRDRELEYHGDRARAREMKLALHRDLHAYFARRALS